MYLLPQPSHHPSLYRNTPFAVALRLRRICSRDDWFEEQLEENHQFFKRRKYKNSVIRKGFDQAKNTSRSNALLSKSRTNDTKRNLVLVMDYHPNLKDLVHVSNFWGLAGSEDFAFATLPTTPLDFQGKISIFCHPTLLKIRFKITVTPPPLLSKMG